MAAVVVGAAAMARWRLLLHVTSYPEAGSGDLRRNVIKKFNFRRTYWYYVIGT
jgi:hypothetical protein